MARELEDLMRRGRSNEEGDHIRFLLKLVMGNNVKIERHQGALTMTFCDGCKLCSVILQRAPSSLSPLQLPSRSGGVPRWLAT